ncbi:Sigma-70, region 4 [compost metagenome]
MARKTKAEKEAELLAAQEAEQNGGIEMENQNVDQEQVQGDVQNEFEGGSTDVDTNAAPDAKEAADEAKDTRVWHSADGKEISKSEFIREKFTVDNLSRKEISEQFDINYRTVYGATVNMTNDAEPSTRGRAASVTKINLTAAGQVATTDTVTEGEGDEAVVVTTYLLNNEAVTAEEYEAATAEGVTEVDRNDWIKEQVAAGVKRADIANYLGLSYGVVYQQTKEESGTRQRYEIEYNGETISRSEYIRRKFAEGMSKADIAKELGVEYPVVWSALKDLKSDDERYLDAVDKLAKLSDLVVEGDAETFGALIEQLKAIGIKQPEPEKAEEASEEQASDAQAPADVEESVYVEDQE